MKFTKAIALIAIIGLAVNASAYNDGTLRRSQSQQVAQADIGSEQTSTKEVNININTNANTASQAQAQQQAVQQPVTIVEAAPVTESRAEALRKARMGAEVQTEQKIVEKLEDSRLQEERARADRLFGNRLDAAPAPVVVPAPVVAPVVVAPAPTPAPAVQEKGTQVTIEKVEIIQPKEIRVEKSEVEVESRMVAPKSEENDASKPKYYISALAGNVNYAASNVKSNYALGVAVGTIIDERIAIELSYLYSNHNVDTYWTAPLYHSLDQNDVSAAAKYYILSGKLKPYIGGAATYINRKYTDKIQNNYYGYGYSNQYASSQTTNAVDLGVLLGADFAVTEHFLIGAGADYNFNVMNTSDNGTYNYGQPDNTVPLEKIAFWTLKLNVKFVF